MARILVQFGRGCGGTIEANWIATGRKMQLGFELTGEKGSLVQKSMELIAREGRGVLVLLRDLRPHSMSEWIVKYDQTARGGRSDERRAIAWSRLRAPQPEGPQRGQAGRPRRDGDRSASRIARSWKA